MAMNRLITRKLVSGLFHIAWFRIQMFFHGLKHGLALGEPQIIVVHPKLSLSKRTHDTQHICLKVSSIGSIYRAKDTSTWKQ